MRSATTTGLALVIAAFLFVCPMGFCAPTASASAEPSHPCCPAKNTPAQIDLPSCSLVFLDNGSAPSLSASADLSVPVFGFFDSPVIWDRNVIAAPSSATVRFSSPPRFVLLHQFLI